jgi:hypothetical protein
MSKKNGWTQEYTAEWTRACRYAFRQMGVRGINELAGERSLEYMSLRNAYFDGHRAGRRSKARSAEARG